MIYKKKKKKAKGKQIFNFAKYKLLNSHEML